MTTNLIRLAEGAQSPANAASLYLASAQDWSWAAGILSAEEQAFAQSLSEKGSTTVKFTKGGSLLIVEFLPTQKKNSRTPAAETLRRQAARTVHTLRHYHIENVLIIGTQSAPNFVYEYAEALCMANYQFRRHVGLSERHPATPLSTVSLRAEDIKEADFVQLSALAEAIHHSRDIVNEPHADMSAEDLAQHFVDTLRPLGVQVQVLDKAAIEAEKMGGLLGVNKGSIVPPTFTIMEWKPANAINEKPIVLVGKGLVYDTGGLSLKPTPDSMDHMKCDMAGGALVGSVMYAVAKTNLPLYVVGLVPSTDNLCDAKAYVPGDVLKMASGHTVEVLNTDAEGRLILGDALHYAKRYTPELVMDFATLTGAVARAIGQMGCGLMGNADAATWAAFEDSAERVYERFVQLPLWDEYGDMIKSEIADIKNTAGPLGGAQTAGKFLEHFTDYPWLHFDIAGTAFYMRGEHYHPHGGTGWGIRLIYDFLLKRAAK